MKQTIPTQVLAELIGPTHHAPAIPGRFRVAGPNGSVAPNELELAVDLAEARLALAKVHALATALLEVCEPAMTRAGATVDRACASRVAISDRLARAVGGDAQAAAWVIGRPDAQAQDEAAVWRAAMRFAQDLLDPTPYRRARSSGKLHPAIARGAL